MKEKQFDANEKGCGKDYGIKVGLYNVKDIISILYVCSKYKGVPMSSHHGEVFNLFKLSDLKLTLSNYGNNLLFLFERNSWRTTFHHKKESCWHTQKESTFTADEKKAIKKMFKEIGIKIETSWNDISESSMISIAVKGKFTFHKRNLITDKEYRKKKKEFIDMCNDFGSLGK